MYCCDGFRNYLSCAGERGLAILACDTLSRHVGFLFQSRGLALGDERKWKPVPIDVMINVSAETGFRFCPFCGRNLDELVQESPEFFKELAVVHKKFLADTPGM